MGKYTINHKTCPECGNRLRHYYFYCGNCGNYDVIDWLKTFKIWLIFVIIFAPLLFVKYQNLKTQCQSSSYTPTVITAIMAKFGQDCKNGK